MYMAETGRTKAWECSKILEHYENKGTMAASNIIL
jgi:hypothetical protein